jgi:hypothetical protein
MRTHQVDKLCKMGLFVQLAWTRGLGFNDQSREALRSRTFTLHDQE